MTVDDLIDKFTDDIWMLHVSKYSPNMPLNDFKNYFNRRLEDMESVSASMQLLSQHVWGNCKEDIIQHYINAIACMRYLVDEHVCLMELINKIQEERQVFINEYLKQNGFSPDEDLTVLNNEADVKRYEKK
ncbi:MAG: hypothetical protein IJJ25_00310 [Lachnospiraceae bacterium]|nr:hypothetical protein [Lachnospiraceae bacterium]MBQ6482760.1 hypothetical protein [Anaerolineaceae bacterium]